jgi:hypothetical protein
MPRFVASSAFLPFASCTSLLGTGHAPPVVVPSSVEPARQDADSKYGPEIGESILQLGGTISSQNQSPGDTTETVSLLAGVGWFQSEWLEIGGQVIGNWSLSSSVDSTTVFIAPYANYNHRVDPRLWLYAGPHFGLGYFDFAGDSASDLEYGLHGGARYWLQPRTNAFAELRWTAASVELRGVDVDFDTTQLLFGFSVVF